MGTTHAMNTAETVVRKSLLNKSKVEYATWGVNHIQGCTHDCLYCYGKTEAHQHKRVDRADWAKPVLVANAVEQVKRELARKKKPVDRVHLCFTSDPFMWDSDAGAVIPEVAQATMEMVRAINEHGVPVTVLTKGVYPELDLGSLDPRNQYGVTAVSLSEAYRQVWEPGAAPVAERLASLKRLADCGARTWVSIEPYPTPNIDASADEVVKLLEELSFIDKFIFGRMNYVRQVTEYLKGDPDFYDRIAGEVVRWCGENDKPLHIKSGTPMHSDETVGILSVADCSKVEDAEATAEAKASAGCGGTTTDTCASGAHAHDVPILVATDESSSLARALELMTDRDRHMLRDRFFLGLTRTEIAERHGTDESDVARSLERALALFRGSRDATQGPELGPNGCPVGYLDNGQFVEFVPDEDSPGEVWTLILRRSDDEILEAQNEFWEKVWWNRHMTSVESGQALPESAMRAAARIEAEYPAEELLLDDFGWGLLCGRLSALSWVTGSEWDESLDT